MGTQKTFAVDLDVDERIFDKLARQITVHYQNHGSLPSYICSSVDDWRKISNGLLIESLFLQTRYGQVEIMPPAN